MHNNWSMVPDDVAAIMGAVDTYMQWNRTTGKQRFYFKYHPSEFGQCLRKSQYRRYAELGFIEVQDEEMDSQKLRLFDKGHNMHNRWAGYFEGLGVLRGYWACIHCSSKGEDIVYGKDDKLGIFRPEQCEICGCSDFGYREISIDDNELNMSGHVDMVVDFSNFDPEKFKQVKPLYDVTKLPKYPVVIDMKTCNDSSFSKILFGGPSLTYQIQLTIYANLLNCEYGLLIYENKNDSRTASFKINKNADTMFQTIRKQALLMNDMVEKKLLPPPRPERKDSYECKGCPFSSICKKSKIWNSPNINETRIKFYGELL